jgi:Mycotoxin biosynthesis protein UstYa
MKIPRSEAVLLPNKTYPIEDLPGYYVAELDVFHQLHCLVSSSSLSPLFHLTNMTTLQNIVRRLHREYYINNPDLLVDEDHVSHCVDAIRQSLM